MIEIDVVVPAHEKDLDTLDCAIKSIRRNISHIRRIIVVSKEKYSQKAEWFDETLFPFSFKDVTENLGSGWHYQQLLKLYAPLIIPNISENVLIIDADTVFFKKVKFFENNLPLYNHSKDTDIETAKFQIESFDHIKKLLPQIDENLPEKYRHISGVCHHMLFQKHLIQELFSLVEKHDKSGDPFYKIFLKHAGSTYVSEYNLYFYFLAALHPHEYKIRILKYKNAAIFNPCFERLRRKYHYCSYHSYMRREGFSIFKKIKNLFYFDQWNIGILNFPINEILKKDLKDIKWLKIPSKLSFYADPFSFKIDKKTFIIFEDYSLIFKSGRIAIAEFLNGKILNKKIILNNNRILSYPYTITHDNRIYMVCESSKTNKLSLYEIDKATLTVIKIRDIFKDKKVIDPSILFYKNKFWIFYTSSEGANSHLSIAFSNSLLGKFIEHPKNPVKISNSSARSAGSLFIDEDQIYRPAQNCSKNYGASVIINRIIKLDEENFSEEFVKEIKPDPLSPYNEALHTISSCGNLTLIDGRKRIFIIYRPLILLFRNFLRALSQIKVF